MNILKKWIDEDKTLHYEVDNPRGYSARFGEVTVIDNVFDCDCVQWNKYDHCSHIDFIKGYPYMKDMDEAQGKAEVEAELSQEMIEEDLADQN